MLLEAGSHDEEMTLYFWFSRIMAHSVFHASRKVQGEESVPAGYQVTFTFPTPTLHTLVKLSIQVTEISKSGCSIFSQMTKQVTSLQMLLMEWLTGMSIR